MEEKKIPIIGQYLNINETVDTLKLKNSIEKKLIKKYSDDLNSDPANVNLIKNFQEISKNMIAMGIKPKMALNSFLVYKYSNIEEGLELLYKNQEGEYNHSFIESDEKLCFICDEEEKSHRSINKILSKKSFYRNSSIEENSELNKKITQKEITLRRSLSKDSSLSESLINEELFENKNEIKFNTFNLSSKNNNDNNKSLISNDKECPICMLDIEPNKNYHLNCYHKFCLDCITEYLSEEIKNSRVSKIKCPQKDCKILFNENLIQKLVCDDVFYKYKKFKLRDKYKNIPNIVCCPITNCEGYANKDNENINLENQFTKSAENESFEKKPLPNINESDTILEIKKSQKTENKTTVKKKLKCNYGHELCSQCISAWHGNEDCEEDKEIKNYAIKSGIIPKKCPKCRVWTEKNLGCNHMTCKICQYNWCWLCLQECLPEHYFQEGSPCFGKQFNENSNPNDLYFMRLIMNHSIYYIATFFIFYLTIFVINIPFLNRGLTNENEGNENNNNQPDNEDNQQHYNINRQNIGDVENNLNNILLESNNQNQNVNNRDLIRNNPNRDITIGQKLGLFLISECIFCVVFLFLAISNGFFLVPLLTLLAQFMTINNKYAKTLAFLTFCVLYSLFYLTGIILACFWLCFTTLYLIYKLIFF